MEEYLNLYNKNKKLMKESVLRSERFNIKKNRYYMVVFLIIENLNKELLLQLTSKSKHSEIALTGGHVQKGSNPLETVIEETKEELGINLDKKKIKFLQSIKLEQEYIEVYHIKDDIKIKDMTLDKNEVESVKFYDYESIKKLLKERKIRKSNRGPIIDFLWLNYHNNK